MNAFVSWSGGKDCMLALYRFLKNTDNKVFCLVNMCDADSESSRSHGLPKKLIASQAKKLNIPLIQKSVSDEVGYEAAFKQVISDIKKQGVTVGVFGDIYLMEHRTWIERVCSEMDIEPVFPLWNDDTRILLQEFIDADFKSLTVSVHCDKLSEEWLGKELNQNFANEIFSLPDIDPCAENGEYHSFVYNGPIFSSPVSFEKGTVSQRDNHFFLSIK